MQLLGEHCLIAGWTQSVIIKHQKATTVDCLSPVIYTAQLCFNKVNSVFLF